MSKTNEKTLEEHSRGVRSVSFSPDGGVLASGSYDKTVKLWDVSSGRVLKTLTGHSDSVNSVSFSPDGQTLASGSEDKTVKLWDVSSGRVLYTLIGHTSSVSSVSFSPDGQTLASGSFDKTVKIWKVSSGHEINTLTGHCGEVLSVSFSPDGQTLASGHLDKTVKLWDVSSGRVLKTLTGHSNWVRSVSFSPDGCMLASGSFDTTIKLWDVSSGRVLKTLTGHSSGVLSVIFSPDGGVLASGSEDKTVRSWSDTTIKLWSDETVKLWDVSSGRVLKTLTGHSNNVYSISFSPDGGVLASGSGDKTIKLWDVSSGREKIKKVRRLAYMSVVVIALCALGLGGWYVQQTRQSQPPSAITTQAQSQVASGSTSTPKPKPQPQRASPPILDIEEITLITFSEGVLDAEETATLKIRIQNVGPGDARNLTIELSGGLQGLSFPRTTNVPTIPKDGGEKTVEIDIRGGFDLPTSTATLDIRVIEPQFKQKVQGKRLRFETRKFQNPELVLADATVVESRSASPNNRIDLNEMIDLKFYVQNRGVGVAEDVAVEVENTQAGVLWLGVADAKGGLERTSPEFSTIDAGKYELVTFSYLVNSEFIAPELRFKISTTERRGQYGFVETKAVGINTELEQLGTLANLPRDDDRPAQRVQIEDLPDLEIDVRKDIPKTAMANPKAVAVVIGNRNYTYRDVPAVEFAHNDALIVKEYLVRTLGYKEENILYHTDASKGAFESVFGTKDDHKGRLFNYVDLRGASDIFIYYSGHGAPDVKSTSPEKPSYLVPVDADPSNVAFGGYPVDLLYRNLKQTPYRHATVVIDACFSGMSAGGPLIRDISGLGLPTLEIPRISQEKSAIFTATGNQQVASWYRDKQHGLFTYFFLKALRGESDRNGDGVLTAVEIQAYVSDHVLSTSRRRNGRDQNPQLTGNQQAVIVRY